MPQEPDRTMAQPDEARETDGASANGAAPAAHDRPASRHTDEERILGGVTHLISIFGAYGFLGMIVIYLLYRRRSPFVAAHAKQAIGLQVTAFILAITMAAITMPMALHCHFGGALGAAFAIGMTTAVLYGFSFIAWLLLVLRATIAGFEGEAYRHPLIGEWIERFGSGNRA